MDYVLLIVDAKDETRGETVPMAEMVKFSNELAGAGKLRSGSPLQPEAQATRVTRRSGRVAAIDGPFAESKEVIAGYMWIDAADRAEALAIAKRCPATRMGCVELQQAATDRAAVPPSGGTRFMLIFIEPPDFDGDPDQAKYNEMMNWIGELQAAHKYVECAALPKSEPGARVKSRRGELEVTDGPFAEAKEIVGGFAILDVENRSDALAWTQRCPHAKWGIVELREVRKVPPL
jgi:hypothetical protein